MPRLVGGPGPAHGWPKREDWVAHSDRAVREDLSSEAAPMDKAPEDSSAREALQVGAGLAQADPPQPHIADGKVLPHEVVQRNTAADDVPTGVSRLEADIIVSCHRSDGLRLDQCDFAPGSRAGRIGPAGNEVSVSLEPFPRNRTDGLQRTHRRLGLRGDVDGCYLAAPFAGAGHEQQNGLRDIIVRYAASGTIASASISTSMFGSISRLT